MNYLIVDTTANSESIYIDAQGENNTLEENAMVFGSKKEANQTIKRNNWGLWAEVKQTDFLVNM